MLRKFVPFSRLVFNFPFSSPIFTHLFIINYEFRNSQIMLLLIKDYCLPNEAFLWHIKDQSLQLPVHAFKEVKSNLAVILNLIFKEQCVRSSVASRCYRWVGIPQLSFWGLFYLITRAVKQINYSLIEFLSSGLLTKAK